MYTLISDPELKNIKSPADELVDNKTKRCALQTISGCNAHLI